MLVITQVISAIKVQVMVIVAIIPKLVVTNNMTQSCEGHLGLLLFHNFMGGSFHPSSRDSFTKFMKCNF